SLIVTVAVLYCVVPPVPAVVRLTVEPFVTATELSIRCAVSAGVVPLKFVTGTKRNCVVAARTSEVASVRFVAMAFQGVPSVDHCQTPCAALAALAEMAMPANVLADEPPLAV